MLLTSELIVRSNMRRFYLTADQLRSCTVDDEEFRHMSVLRMGVGDRFIGLSDNSTMDNVYELTDISKKSATFKFVEQIENHANPKLNIVVFQALAKGDKLETVTQKATELGASGICPLYLKNCDVKEGSGKVNRLDKIAISATKQCGRSLVPKVLDTINIKGLENTLSDFDLIILANEREDKLPLIDVLNQNKSAKSIAIIVGPEGGFTDEEIEKIISLGGKSVTLGTRILRTETAGLYMLSVINEVLDN